MSSPAASPVLAQLRARIARLEGEGARLRAVLPFGIAPLDGRLPGGGLALGCLHEVASAGDGAAAACFAAGIAARIPGPVLWVAAVPDLFAPGLEQAGLAPGRVIHVEAGSDKAVLACMEEGLRHGTLGTVLGEAARLPMALSRRLHLAAKGTGTTCIALRRQGRAEAGEQPGAAMTRWRVASRPSAPLPVPGVGRARWRVELLRARGGEGFAMELEACDEAGRLGLPAARDGEAAGGDGVCLDERRKGYDPNHLGLPAGLAGGPAAAAGGRRGAAG